MTHLHIRPFHPQDTDAIVTLWQACGLVVPWNDPYKDIARKQQVAPDLFLVGEQNDRIVATAMGGYEGHRGWVNYLAVAPNLRRQGLGRALMTALETKLIERGCPKINLQIRATNTAVIQFYQKLGYQTDQVVSLGKRLIPDN